MQGLVTEKHWDEVEQAFPAIHQFYCRLPRKPRTFLKLLELFHCFETTQKPSRKAKGHKTSKI